MRDEKTALIIGAGASHSFGLPIGSGLRDQISRDLNLKFDRIGQNLTSGDHTIFQAMRALIKSDIHSQIDVNSYRRSAVQISDRIKLEDSIDTYIDRFKDDKIKIYCAKFAISLAILRAERKSNLYRKNFGEVGSFILDNSSNWIARFMKAITRGVNIGNLENIFENTTIVNFNYDRCFEHYCFHWLKQMYESLEDSKAAEIIKSIKIYHPYGKLGDLVFENPIENIPFGAEPTANNLIKIAKRLRTYGEAAEDTSKLSEFRDRLAEVDKFVFLGFGFHQPNLDIISTPLKVDDRRVRYYATRLGISEPNWNAIKGRVNSAINGYSDLAYDIDGDCERLWEDYSEELTR